MLSVLVLLFSITAFAQGTTYYEHIGESFEQLTYVMGKGDIQKMTDESFVVFYPQKTHTISFAVKHGVVAAACLSVAFQSEAVANKFVKYAAQSIREGYVGEIVKVKNTNRYTVHVFVSKEGKST